MQLSSVVLSLVRNLDKRGLDALLQKLDSRDFEEGENRIAFYSLPALAEHLEDRPRNEQLVYSIFELLKSVHWIRLVFASHTAQVELSLFTTYPSLLELLDSSQTWMMVRFAVKLLDSGDAYDFVEQMLKYKHLGWRESPPFTFYKNYYWFLEDVLATVYNRRFEMFDNATPIKHSTPSKRVVRTAKDEIIARQKLKQFVLLFAETGLLTDTDHFTRMDNGLQSLVRETLDERERSYAPGGKRYYEAMEHFYRLKY